MIQVGFQYYFVPNKITLEGSRSVKGDVLTVQSGKAVQVYKTKALTKEEVFAFYKPEINRLLLLGGGYFALPGGVGRGEGASSVDATPP